MKYSKEELSKLILEDNLSYEAIGRIYGVTGGAIKKAAKSYNIDLPQRRIINQNENFSCKRNTKIDKFTDEEFTDIIKHNIGWKDISLALGYKQVPDNNIHKKIEERCLKLGIELRLQKPSPILTRTKGEFIKMSKNYQSYRGSVRRLAELTYKNSGKECKCAICGYSNHIEVAHIKAVSEFDHFVTIAEINSIDNLIALCPNHHWEYDNGLLKL